MSFGSKKATQTTAPSAQAQRFINQGLQTLAGGLDPETEQARRIAGQEAGLGQAGFQQAERTLGQTARGDFLFGGQGFNEAVQAAQNQVLPQITSAFESRGRAGSGLAAQAAARALGGVFANTFEQERGRQLAAAQALPRLQAQQFAGLGQLANLGQLPALQAQQLISGAGALGQTTTKATPRSPFAGALGGGILAGEASGGNPLAIAGGAGAGFLGGLF